MCKPCPVGGGAGDATRFARPRWDKSDRYRRLGLELPPGDEPRTRDLQEHHQLVSLIADGRAAEAAQLMRGDITHSLTATAISALEDREGIRGT
ncbi:hypothetical protein GCM10010244_46180 [Streptomyces coeruleorubidus]|nr:hypothetical protein GCM10010244_46180 [Streptomyces bellus]